MKPADRVQRLIHWTVRRAYQSRTLRSVLQRTNVALWATDVADSVLDKLSDGSTLHVGGVEAQFAPPARVGMSHFASEHTTIEDILDSIDDGDVFYDVGAHVGLYACTVGQRADRTVCFEPFPPNRDTLRENLRRNGIDAEVVGHALSDSAGTLEFPDPDQGPRGAVSAHAKAQNTITVEAVTGDGVIRERGLPSPDIVKIDVEGDELVALRGLQSHLPDARLIYCEIHPHRLQSGEDRVVDFLEDNGFDARVLDRTQKTVMIKAERR